MEKPPAVEAALREHEFVATLPADPEIVVAVGETRTEIVSALNFKFGHPRPGAIIHSRHPAPPAIIRGNPSRGRR